MKRLLAAILVPVIVFIGVFIWWKQGLSPVNAQDKSQVLFVVPEGSGIRAISNDLKEQGLIKDDIVFFLLIKQLGYDKKIQAGDFRLSPSMSAKEIAEELTTGTLDIWVTIPEGKRAEEIADIMSDRLPGYEESWRDILIANEGYLFPDTYLIPRDADIETVVAILRNTFEQKYATVTNSTGLTREQIVILASMIEREAKHDEDRPIVSSVMHNRLNINMGLQIDATIQYAKGKIGDNWWYPVTLSEYQSVKSPYNTYLQAGLPPGPISNPGLPSLEAAANPARTDYIYYITDKNGVNRYSKTAEGHQENIRRYGLSS